MRKGGAKTLCRSALATGPRVGMTHVARMFLWEQDAPKTDTSLRSRFSPFFKPIYTFLQSTLSAEHNLYQKMSFWKTDPPVGYEFGL